uniref:Uncharacterized protein n=1 Tax=Rhizophora mucronata TaxID=61149 RepID=A0A2P2PKQ2_RHIMU
MMLTCSLLHGSEIECTNLSHSCTQHLALQFRLK